MGVMGTRDGAASQVGVSLHDVLRGDGLYCVYQPFVDVDTGAVLAFEALLRGPENTALHSPMALLDAAVQPVGSLS